MQCLLFLFLLLPIFVQSFESDEDPTFVHHVNVISGCLNLSFQDFTVEGPVPIPIQRHYSSAGALECSTDNTDILLDGLRVGWMLQGGWDLLPQTNLLIEPSADDQNYKAHLEKITYSYSHKQDKHLLFLKPIHSVSQVSGHLSSRTNPQNNLLCINLKTGIATLSLPNGGSRQYQGHPFKYYRSNGIDKYYYLLKAETLPSQHKLFYSYDKKYNLNKISATNPANSKIYTFADIDPSSIQFNTSDGKQVHYKTMNHEGRDYLNEIESNCRIHEKSHFIPGRKGIGARMASFELGGAERFKVRYYLPCNADNERKWAQKPEQKDFHIDKVESLSAPVGPHGEDVRIAQFTYFPGRTDVRDDEGLLTQYYYDGEQLHKIDYFDGKGALHSSQRFYWDGSYLRCKAMIDAKGHPLFVKTFSYKDGDVVEEILWGQLTGQPIEPLQIDDYGNPSGAESYRKTYTYYEGSHLLKTEEEEEGPSYHYSYKPGTDLLEEKLTKDLKGRILIRETRSYNNDNLLIAEAVDDGNGLQRREKRYEINPKTGLPDAVTESNGKRIQLTYVNQKVREEKVFDAEGKYRYTLYTDYDSLGHVKRKTTPSGRENTYLYDSLGQLKEAKEVGSPKKVYEYDKAGRQISCLNTETKKTATTSYDTKGRVLAQTDFKGHTTRHSYDDFGNRVTTQLPTNIIARFGYDLHGNLTTATLPHGGTTTTSYNLLRKPTHVIQPDGSEVKHFYNKNGTLAKTIQPDLSEVHYTYDLFQHMTSKTLYSAHQKMLSQERWVYDAFQLRSYTDPRGLTTEFFYDEAGRKNKEVVGERTTIYSYDALGFLEKTDNGAVVLTQKHNIEGLVEEQWEENGENRMQFFYDQENRKEKAIRWTSQGEAMDLFEYKEGKLVQHTDPKGAITQFVYDDSHKTTIDPLENISIETYDIGGRLVLLEKQDSQRQTVFKEEYLYDLPENCSKLISYVYLEGNFLRKNTVERQHDVMGRVIQETEEGAKTTSCEYDVKGRMKWKRLPNGVQIDYTYDGADHLIELCSSDGSVHIQSIYKGPDPIEITDLVHKKTLKRAYNLFGQIIEETNSEGLTLKWDYDAFERCTALTLPDKSSVHYSFIGPHMSSVQRKAADQSLLYEHTYDAFDPNGHVTEEKLIFQLGSVKTKHDLLERPSIQTCPWIEQTVSYDPSGLVKSAHSSLFGDKIYDYDALKQLKTEGEKSYVFDSLGNPADCVINALNQVQMTPDGSITYDVNGNPKERVFADQITHYDYDSLGRLIEMTSGQTKKVRYLYDPLSRLLAKEIYEYTAGSWRQEKKVLYLYDQDKEVGALDEQGHLLEFKALGLGLEEDIGAAIAIELNGAVYAPLHDFRGNVIALIASTGQIAESYDLDAFGREKTSKKKPINPWRFCSKRTEEGLIFFGLRFYDPSLGRWLTPDPSGFSDGMNLYAYALNSPLNRLDLFGLSSEDLFKNGGDIHVYVPIWQFILTPEIGGFLCKGTVNGAWADFSTFHTQWYKLQFTAAEKIAGEVDLANHLPELIPSKGGEISLVSIGTGIDTSLKEFGIAADTIARKVAGPFMLSLYNPTEGRSADIDRTTLERHHIETPTVSRTRQFMVWASTQLHNINPEAYMQMIVHSENGVITKRAIEGMNPEQQTLLRKNLYVLAVAPAEPLRRDQAASAINVYSKKDYITGFGSFGWGQHFLNDPDYDIRILECKSGIFDKNLFIADHGFLKPTYSKAWKDYIQESQKEIGYYGKNR